MIRQSMTDYGMPLQETTADVPDPKGEEIVMRISHCGVCHSDLHIQDGFFNLGEGQELDVRTGRELPFTLGHEISGTIAAMGPQADGLDTSKRYAVYPWMGCGECPTCASGDEHLCNTAHHLGITVDGGFATHVLVPHKRYLLDVSDIETSLAGSYMCSGLTAFSALKKVSGQLVDGGTLMIVGLGGVGMMALQFANALYPNATIIAADIDEEKRGLALKAGAEHVFDPSEPDARKQVFKTTGAVAASIDFVGAESSLYFAQAILEKGGLTVIAGLLGGKFSLPIPMFPLRVITLSGSFVGSLPEAQEMLDLVRSGAVQPIPVDARTLSDANSALDDLRAGKVVGRVVLTV
ncbi:MAG: alcohol dehydrogenase [Hyphomicrobiales bacterium]